jgi:hypothetical protein
MLNIEMVEKTTYTETYFKLKMNVLLQLQNFHVFSTNTALVFVIVFHVNYIQLKYFIEIVYCYPQPRYR